MSDDRRAPRPCRRDSDHTSDRRSPWAVTAASLARLAPSAACSRPRTMPSLLLGRVAWLEAKQRLRQLHSALPSVQAQTRGCGWAMIWSSGVGAAWRSLRGLRRGHPRTTVTPPQRAAGRVIIEDRAPSPRRRRDSNACLTNEVQSNLGQGEHPDSLQALAVAVCGASAAGPLQSLAMSATEPFSLEAGDGALESLAFRTLAPSALWRSAPRSDVGVGSCERTNGAVAAF